jgi:hypothetical protein
MSRAGTNREDSGLDTRSHTRQIPFGHSLRRQIFDRIIIINNPSSSLAQDSGVRTQRVATSAARFPWPAVGTSQYVMNHDELLINKQINKLLIRL